MREMRGKTGGDCGDKMIRSKREMGSKLKYTLYKLHNILIHQKNESRLGEIADIT